jgi:hypothetical protein
MHRFGVFGGFLLVIFLLLLSACLVTKGILPLQIVSKNQDQEKIAAFLHQDSNDGFCRSCGAGFGMLACSFLVAQGVKKK